MDTKVCSKCDEEKPVSSFTPRSCNTDGLSKRCWDCGAPDRARQARLMESRQLRFETDPDYRERRRAYDRKRVRDQRDRRYGLPPGTVEQMEQDQDGRCAVCRRTPAEVACKGDSGTQLHVDHDHACCATNDRRDPACGQCVRSMLCKKCNGALAMVDDDPTRLMALIEYLVLWGKVAPGQWAEQTGVMS